MIHVLTSTGTINHDHPFATEFRPDGDSVEVVRHYLSRPVERSRYNRDMARSLWRQSMRGGRWEHLGSFPNADRAFLAIRDFVNP